MTQHTSINISILGKDFSVACGVDEQDDLLAAARFLDANMKEIQKTGKVIGSERCAIMSALNITNDLLKLREKSSQTEQIEKRLFSLQGKIDDALKEAENF